MSHRFVVRFGQTQFLHVDPPVSSQAWGGGTKVPLARLAYRCEKEAE